MAGGMEGVRRFPKDVPWLAETDPETKLQERGKDAFILPGSAP